MRARSLSWLLPWLPLVVAVVVAQRVGSGEGAIGCGEEPCEGKARVDGSRRVQGEVDAAAQYGQVGKCGCGVSPRRLMVRRRASLFGGGPAR